MAPQRQPADSRLSDWRPTPGLAGRQLTGMPMHAASTHSMWRQPSAGMSASLAQRAGARVPDHRVVKALAGDQDTAHAAIEAVLTEQQRPLAWK